MEMAGGFKFEEEIFTAVSSNITPDKGTGIGGWTDAEIITAIREGRRPDGTVIGPPMPVELYRRLSDRDVRAIVAYLRTVKPVRNKVAKSVYKIPLPKSYGPPVAGVPEVSRPDKVRYGEYLAGPLGHCIECHTPLVKGRRDYKNRLGAGGFPFHGPWGVVVSTNITPAPDRGIGNWTDQQIINATILGVRPNGGKMNPPMPYDYYKNISPNDLEAIVAYLRSLKPISGTK